MHADSAEVNVSIVTIVHLIQNEEITTSVKVVDHVSIVSIQ